MYICPAKENECVGLLTVVAISVGDWGGRAPKAFGARIEAARGRVWGGGPHRGRGMGRGLCPLPRKFFDFWAQKGAFRCILDVIFAVELKWKLVKPRGEFWWCFDLVWNWNLYFWRWLFTTDHTPPVCRRQFLCNVCAAITPILTVQ